VLIGVRPRSATVIAKSDRRLAPIDTNRFAFLVQQTPHFAIQVMWTMANRWRHPHFCVYSGCGALTFHTLPTGCSR